MPDAKLTTIWKFPLALQEKQVVSMPVGAVLLRLGLDGDATSPKICMWLAVDADALKPEVEIVLVGTGHPLPHVGSFLGTVVDGRFVWHFFTGPGHEIRRDTSFHYLTKGRA